MEHAPLSKDELLRLAHDRVAGGLPCRPPERMWAGPGAGFDCSLCGRPVTDKELEYELQFSIFPNVVTCRFHRPCHEAWESICPRDR